MAPKHHDKHRLLNQPRLISFNRISTGNVFFSPKHEKTAFANFPVYQEDVLGWRDLKERIYTVLKKNVISFDPPKVLLFILEFVLVKSIFIYTQTEIIINAN